MSLVMGFRLADRVVLMADSAALQGWVRVHSNPKLTVVGPHLVGFVGDYDDIHHYARG